MTAQRIYRLALAALIVLFFAVRIWGLADSCLWFDEIFSVHAAEHSWRTIFPFVAQDLIHPPLYYALLKIWIAFGGESTFWLRTFSVLIAGVGLIPLLLLCKVFNLRSRTILISVFLIAVNGPLIKYSQEVRMYSLLMCLSLFSFWLFARFVRQGSGILALLAINVLLVYSHYFGWFVIFCEIACVVLWYRHRLKHIMLIFVGVFAAFLPWLSYVWSMSGGGGLDQNIGWVARPGLGDVVSLLLGAVEPFYFARISTDAVSDYRVSVPLSIIFAALAIAFVTGGKRSDDERRNDRDLLAFVLTPVIAALVLSWILPYSIWGIRHLIFVFPILMIAAGRAVDNFPVKPFRIAALTLIVLFSGYAFVVNASRSEIRNSWCGWEELEMRLPASDDRRPINVYAFEDLVAYHLWFNVRNDSNVFRVFKVTGIAGILEDKAYFLPRGFDAVTRVDIDAISEDRFWIAFRAEDLNVTKPPLSEFILRGYRVEDRISSQADDGELFLVLLEKVGGDSKAGSR